MDLNTTITNDLLTIEGQLSSNNVFTCDGSEYNYIPGGTDTTAASLIKGGFHSDSETIIVVRANQFFDNIFPQTEDIITINAVDYEVSHADIDDLGSGFYAFYLVLPSP